MKYGVFSDSHDNQYNFRKAIEIAKSRGVTKAFHLGDIVAPPTAGIMAENADIQWWVVWGNCDGAKVLTLLRNKDAKNLDFAPESHRELELPEGKVFLAHFPILAQNAAKSGEYKACFYGDDHQKFQETLENNTLLANPGEIAGTRTGQPSFGIWDTDTNTFEIIDLPDFKVGK